MDRMTMCVQMGFFMELQLQIKEAHQSGKQDFERNHIEKDINKTGPKSQRNQQKGFN